MSSSEPYEGERERRISCKSSSPHPEKVALHLGPRPSRRAYHLGTSAPRSPNSPRSWRLDPQCPTGFGDRGAEIPKKACPPKGPSP
eukprot:1591588-Alexandrium_andersonii.AAC.1